MQDGLIIPYQVIRGEHLNGVICADINQRCLGISGAGEGKSNGKVGWMDGRMNTLLGDGAIFEQVQMHG